MKAQTDKKMKIVDNAFYEVINYIGSHPAECGGALFGSEDDYVIRKFIPDTDALTTRSTYTINTDYLNPVIKRLWEEEGLSLLGVVHSHPNGYSSLSGPDMQYFSKLLGSIKREQFYCPIVFSVADGGFKFFPHILGPDGRTYQTGSVELVPENHIEESNNYISDKMHEFGITETIEMPEIKSPDYFKKIIQMEVFFLKAIMIAWAGWLLIRITIPITSFIIKIIEHGTK